MYICMQLVLILSQSCLDKIAKLSLEPNCSLAAPTPLIQIYANKEIYEMQDKQKQSGVNNSLQTCEVQNNMYYDQALAAPCKFLPSEDDFIITTDPTEYCLHCTTCLTGIIPCVSKQVFIYFLTKLVCPIHLENHT